MIQVMLAAFTIGVAGSFHCVGMCGPLALSLPLNDDTWWNKLSGTFLYNAGRIIMYSVFGLVFGLIGKSFALFGYQQWVSIILGLLIITFVFLPKKVVAFKQNNMVLLFFERLRNSLSKFFSRKNHSSLFFIGILNGLLPCGLVYMAAAVAVTSGDVVSAVLFMAFFGLGTLPVMWSISLMGNYIGAGIRQKIRRAYPYMMGLMACLLILRGMGLGIPYISPQLNEQEAATVKCCSKP